MVIVFVVVAVIVVVVEDDDDDDDDDDEDDDAGFTTSEVEVGGERVLPTTYSVKHAMQMRNVDGQPIWKQDHGMTPRKSRE